MIKFNRIVILAPSLCFDEFITSRFDDSRRVVIQLGLNLPVSG